jgi:hypothetical protein
MEIYGAAYLYTLAALGMAFLGFTSIVIIIRQSLGAVGLSPIQLLVTKALIEHGFVVVGFSIFPILLALFDLSHEMVWRISSGAAGAIIAIWHIHYAVWRYPAVRSHHRHPTFARINFGITGVGVIALFCNTIGLPFKTQVGPYAAMITWMLFEGGVARQEKQRLWITLVSDFCDH